MENEVMNLAEKTVTALTATMQTITPYVPTKYVDYSEPDIDAEHLNHAENAIKLATDALNLAIDTINTLSSAVDQLNRDMEYKSVSVEKNADCVADSYSLGFKKSGICVLTLDVYTNETIEPYTEYTILRTGFRPQRQEAINFVSSTGKAIALSCAQDGSVKLNSNEASGKFNIRGQLVFV